MPNEQIDAFQQYEAIRIGLQEKAVHVLEEANARIDGAISAGHLESLLASALENEAGIHVDDAIRSEIHEAVESADGNRNKVDYRHLAEIVVNAVRPAA